MTPVTCLCAIQAAPQRQRKRQRTLLLRAVRRRRARVDCGGTVRMETFQLAQIGVVFCCLVGLWVRGGREPIQGYIFTVAFIFNLLLTAVLGY